MQCRRETPPLSRTSQHCILRVVALQYLALQSRQIAYRTPEGQRKGWAADAGVVCLGPTMQTDRDDVNLLGGEKNWLERNRKVLSIVSVFVGIAIFTAIAAGVGVAVSRVSYRSRHTTSVMWRRTTPTCAVLLTLRPARFAHPRAVHAPDQSFLLWQDMCDLVYQTRTWLQELRPGCQQHGSPREMCVSWALFAC